MKYPAFLLSGLLIACIVSGVTVAAQTTQGAGNCGELANAYGPFDYRKERYRLLQIVEGHHFTPDVENLVRGKSGHLGADLDYTLRASPNHHRALMAVSNYGIRERSPKPNSLRWTVDCYFDRALRFQPDDVLVPMLFANYLLKTNRADEAKSQLARAAHLAGDNPLTHYNVGLLYLDANDLDRALVHAQKARDLGNPRGELLEKLRAAGKAVDSAEPAKPN